MKLMSVLRRFRKRKTGYKSTKKWYFLVSLIAIAYCVAELAFNTILVDFVATSKTSSSMIDDLAKLGEILSSIGLTLLIISFIDKKIGVSKRAGFYAALGLTAVIGGGSYLLMSWMQPAIVETIVKYSSPDDRVKALNMHLLKDAVISGSIVFNDKTIGTENSDKVFLALIGPMAIGNNLIHERIVDAQDDIIKSIVVNKNKGEDVEKWGQYQQIALNARQKYKQYVNSVNNLVHVSGPSVAIDSFLSIRDEIRESNKNKYNRYTQDTMRFSNLTSGSFIFSLVEPLRSYQSKLRQCAVSGCHDQLIYEFGSIFARDFTKGYRANPDQLLAFGDTQKGIQKAYDTYVRSAHFEHNTGFPPGLDYAAYSRHPKACAAASQEARSKGLNVPKGWCPFDEGKLVAVAIDQKQESSSAAWDRESKRKYGKVIPQNLSEKQFRDLPVIKNSIAAALRSFPCARDNPWLSASQFQKQCVLDSLNKNVDSMERAYGMTASMLADDGEYASRGKSAIRSLVIPPVAIGFSLFFSLLTITKVFGPLRVLAVGALIIVPFFYEPENSDIAQYMLSSTESSWSFYGIIIHWIMVVEPFIFGISSTVLSSFT